MGMSKKYIIIKIVVGYYFVKWCKVSGKWKGEACPELCERVGIFE